VIVYLDASAFVKLVIDEPGSMDVAEWFFRARRAASSVIAYPEASAALYRRDRDAESTPSRLTAWISELDSRWERIFSIPVAEQASGRLAVTHGLRGMDAVHLAAAMTLREGVRADSPGSDVAFAAFDRQLLAAAEREGFATLGGPLD
jgi:predicted nucleic acid-binding protein